MSKVLKVVAMVAMVAAVAVAVGRYAHKLHTPWGSVTVWMSPKEAGENASWAFSRALEIEISAPGTLEKVCKSWRIEETAEAVSSICNKLQEEVAFRARVKAESEARLRPQLRALAQARAQAEAEAEAEALAQARALAQERAEALAQAEEETNELLRRIDLLHAAGGPID